MFDHSANVVPAQSLLQQAIFHRLPGPWTIAALSAAVIAVVFLPAISMVAMFSIWWERKVAGHIQSRIGPNRVGPIGLLQSIADGVKLLLKEDLRPASADHFLFALAPYLVFAPVFAAFLAIPFGPDLIFEPRLSVGLFWILAILSLQALGVILAGWGSNNKWAVYGSMREACQMVSYEIPLGLSILVAVMTAGTLSLIQLGWAQSGGIHTWLLFRSPFVFAAFGLYFVASLASNKRAPFDLPESESELVAGFHTEYSGLRFSFFFFAEYAGMFVVAAIQTALFLGAWNDPFGLIGFLYPRLHDAYWHGSTLHALWPLVAINLFGATLFIVKCLMLVYVQMWLRWTLPRPRIDQVLYACMKVFLPFACLLIVGQAAWQLFVPEMPGTPWADYAPWKILSWSFNGSGRLATAVTQILLATIGLGIFTAVISWIGYAFLTGRGIVQRLTPPEQIFIPGRVAS